MRRHEKKRLLVLIVVGLSFFLLFTSYYRKSHSIDEFPDQDFSKIKKASHFIQEDENKVYQLEKIGSNSSYINNVDSVRINKLFRILQEKEKNYRPIIKDLKLLSFEDIALKNDQKDRFKVNNGQVEITEELVTFLRKQSDFNSFGYSRTKIDPAKITEVQMIQIGIDLNKISYLFLVLLA